MAEVKTIPKDKAEAAKLRKKLLEEFTGRYLPVLRSRSKKEAIVHMELCDYLWKDIKRNMPAVRRLIDLMMRGEEERQLIFKMRSHPKLKESYDKLFHDVYLFTKEYKCVPPDAWRPWMKTLRRISSLSVSGRLFSQLNRLLDMTEHAWATTKRFVSKIVFDGAPRSLEEALELQGMLIIVYDDVESMYEVVGLRPPARVRRELEYMHRGYLSLLDKLRELNALESGAASKSLMDYIGGSSKIGGSNE